MNYDKEMEDRISRHRAMIWYEELLAFLAVSEPEEFLEREYEFRNRNLMEL